MNTNTKTDQLEHKPLPSPLEEAYGDGYLKWKSWENAEFGKLTQVERAYFTAEIKRARHNFPINSNVLEIGFGNGAFLKYARDKNWNVFGTEINEALVKIALRCELNASHSANLSNFNDDFFDLVVAFDVLEHIPQDALPDFLHEIRRVLKKDGFFIARFPNGDSPASRRLGIAR